MLQSRAVCTHRRQWPQVHHLPHDNMFFSFCSLSSCLLSLLFPSAFNPFIFPSCFCILPISSLWISLLCFFSLISSCFTPFSFLLCSSPPIIPHYLSSPLSSSFFLFPSHLFFLLLYTQLLYSSPHFFSFFLFPLVVNCHLSSLLLFPLLFPSSVLLYPPLLTVFI